MHEVAAAIGRAIGKEVVYVDVPEEGYRQGALAHGAPPWLVDGIMELNAVFKAGQASAVTPWVERITGKKPYDIDAFARTYASAWS
jgi:hypothetical protein